MNIRERFRNDLETYRRLGGKQRRAFVWDYYKAPIIAAAALAVLCAAVSAARGGRAQTVLYAVLVNANGEARSDVMDEILARGGTDMTGRRVSVEAGYTLRYGDVTETDAQTVQVLAVLFGIGDLDVFVADEPVFETYAAQNAFVDLRLFMQEELQSVSVDDLYVYSDPDGREIVGGVWLREDSPLHAAGYYQGGVLVGIAAQAGNLDNALRLLRGLIGSG